MTRSVLKLPKGLSRADALRAARRRWGGDFRGFTYDAKTGRTVLV